MTQLLTSSSDHLLADLVEELSRKLAEGNSEDVEGFLADHAEHAEKLRPLIPTLQMLVEIGSSPVAGGRSRTNLAEEKNGHETNGHPVLGDFRILREVGRGGMGVVYEAEQISLRRRVALKVLPSAAMLDPRALQRFRNEAQAAAALHHSQIVPIFGVGCERGVHYYAMQFIDGLTLAEVITVLRESAGLGPLYQPDPLHQPEAQAKDTSAKAEVGKRKAEAMQPTVDHPSSAPAPIPQPPAPPSPTETDVLAALSTEKSRTSPAWFRRIAEQFAQVADALHHAHELGVTHRDIKPANLMLDRLGHIWITDFGLARIEGEGNLTMTGDLIGTLRYMSPEQALAKRIGIDHRTDIYSLGITLYELLTLHPALPGQGRQEILRQIAFEEPKSPRKLNAGIPRDLETIVLKMIEKNPAERYQTAAELAADLKRFVDDRHITARRPSLYVRTTRWTKRRQGLVSATAIILLLAAAGGLGWMYDHSRRVGKATALVNDALQETAFRRIEAQTKRDDLIAWEQASSSAQRARALTESGPVSISLAQEANDLARNVDDEHSQARIRWQSASRDARMLKDLTNAALEGASVKDDEFDYDKMHEARKTAFIDYGIDLSKLSDEEVARRIRTSAIRETLVSTLINWSIRSEPRRPRKPSSQFLLDVAARVATESPAWHKQLIQALQVGELEGLQAIARASSTNTMPPDGVRCVARALEGEKDAASALALYRALLQRKPGDFWLNEGVGMLLSDMDPKSADAIRYLTAAVALCPDSPAAHLNLSTALWDQGRLDEAIAECRESIRLQATYAKAHSNLGGLLVKQKKLDEGIVECREAIRLQPTYPEGHCNLGSALSGQGKHEEAIAAYGEAIRLEPMSPIYHANLGDALRDLGKLDEAIVACREAIRLQPTLASTHASLGIILGKQGNLDEEIAAYREAIRLQPDVAYVYANLGSALWSRRDWVESIAACREAIRLEPESESAYCTLGMSQVEIGDFKGALEAMRKGHELGSRKPRWTTPTESYIAEIERLVGLDAQFTELKNGGSSTLTASKRAELAKFALSEKHLPTTAIKWYEQAFAEDPSLAADVKSDHSYNAACAALLTANVEPKQGEGIKNSEPARLKHQSLLWLRDNLAGWEELAKSGSADQLPTILEKLAHWQEDSDLATLRDEKRVQQLPPEDQDICRKLWADHAELVKRLQGMLPPAGK